VKPLVELNNIADKWAEDIVLQICFIARDSSHDVFNHLTLAGNFRSRRKTIDRAVQLIKQIDAGLFLTRHGQIFKTFPEHVLEARRIDLVTKRVKQLKGDRDAIKSVLLRCTRNYLTALSPGFDVPDFIKKGYPKTVDNFLLFDNGTGSAKPYFMLFYLSPDTSEQQLLENTMASVKKKSELMYTAAANYADKIKRYDDDVKIRKAYWLNISKLHKEFALLKEKNMTSYSIITCFDFVLKQADKLYETYGSVNKGSFELDSQTVKNAIREIRNK